MQSKEETIKGTVIETMPNTLFKVITEDKQEITAYLAGKMRVHRIRVLIGDTVEMIPEPYGGKARIIKRL